LNVRARIFQNPYNGTQDICWILEVKDYPKLWWELICEYFCTVLQSEPEQAESPYGHKSSVFKMLPVGRRKLELVVNIPRLYWKDCGTIRQPHFAFADPKKHYTRSLERFVVDLCRIMSIQDVVELTGLGWD
jgi:hypothetical protein